MLWTSFRARGHGASPKNIAKRPHCYTFRTMLVFMGSEYADLVFAQTPIEGD